jgi:hypothetical protein
MMSHKAKLFLIIGLIFSARALYAAEGAGSQFGVVYGQSVPDADNTNARKLFGVKGGAFLTPTFSMGGYFFESEKNQGTGGADFRYSLHGLEGAFHLGGGSGDTFVSLRVGLSKVRTDVVGTDAIFSPYHYGVASGYDFPILTWLYLGFEGSFVHVEKSSTEELGTSYSLDAFSVINFLLTLQLRL